MSLVSFAFWGNVNDSRRLSRVLRYILHTFCDTIFWMTAPKKPDRHLLMRGSVWHYQRRVPRKYRRFDSRRFVRESLGISSLEIARIRRDELARADDAYWAALAVAAATGREDGGADGSSLREYYKAQRAQANGAGQTGSKGTRHYNQTSEKKPEESACLHPTKLGQCPRCVPDLHQSAHLVVVVDRDRIDVM